MIAEGVSFGTGLLVLMVVWGVGYLLVQIITGEFDERR